LLENLRFADVTRVNDVFGPAQRRERFGTKQAVRVGDNTDQNGSLSFQLPSYDWNS
jgi:hypothetical protein